MQSHCFLISPILFPGGGRVALTVIQAPPPCGSDSDQRAESVSPSTTLRSSSGGGSMSVGKPQRPPSPANSSVLLTSTTSNTGGEQRRVTAPQPPHVSLQVTASSLDSGYEC